MTPERRKKLYERVERATELPMLILALIFLMAVLLPEIMELSPEWHLALEEITWVVWAAFVFELLLKLYLVSDRRNYLITHWMDVISVMVPFLRPLAVLRVAAVGIRFWVEARTVLRRRTLGVIGTTSVLAVITAAGLMFLYERGGEGPIQNFPDALWWATVTITTVGYGDMYPRTPQGRGVAVILMLIGISLFGLLTAKVAAFFVEADDATANQHAGEIAQRLQHMEALLSEQALARRRIRPRQHRSRRPAIR